MKLKYLLTGLLISLLSISSSFAINELNLAGMGQNIGGDTTNFCVIKSDLSFDCSDTDYVLASYTNGGNADIGTSFWRRNDGLGFYYKWNNGNLQGVITGFTFCPGDYVNGDSFNQYWNGCTDTLSYGEFKQYVGSHQLKKRGWATFYAYRGNGGPVFVFDEGAFRLSFDIGGNNYSSLLYGTYFLQDFGLSGNPINVDYSNVGLINSPVSNSNPPQYYYSTGSCPSVGQLKASTKLIPAVCYGGYGSDIIYTAGETTPFVGGSGLDVFQIYSLTSGGMQLQTWYDTYWVYYNNISSDPSPFYNKPKALLGLQLARQLGSMYGNIGSSTILNYCYYVVNDISDNISTCVSSNVSTVYSGFTFTDQDREDILDSIVGRQDSVRIQSGFDTGDLTDIYNQSYSLFSSWTVDPGFNGILPSYIIIGFLGIVLLYFLRR